MLLMVDCCKNTIMLENIIFLFIYFLSALILPIDYGTIYADEEDAKEKLKFTGPASHITAALMGKRTKAANRRWKVFFNIFFSLISFSYTIFYCFLLWQTIWLIYHFGLCIRSAIFSIPHPSYNHWFKPEICTFLALVLHCLVFFHTLRFGMFCFFNISSRYTWTLWWCLLF